MAQEGICIAAEDTGGNYARTMLLDLATGDVIVRTVGRPERIYSQGFHLWWCHHR